MKEFHSNPAAPGAGESVGFYLNLRGRERERRLSYLRGTHKRISRSKDVSGFRDHAQAAAIGSSAWLVVFTSPVTAFTRTYQLWKLRLRVICFSFRHFVIVVGVEMTKPLRNVGP